MILVGLYELKLAESALCYHGMGIRLGSGYEEERLKAEDNSGG